MWNAITVLIVWYNGGFDKFNTFKNKYIAWFFDAYFSKILDGFLLVCDAGLLFLVVM